MRYELTSGRLGAGTAQDEARTTARRVAHPVLWIATIALAAQLAAAPLAAQGGMGGMMGGGMGRGGMMGGDSTTMAVMQVVHQLMTNHDKLRRTVTNLPDGIRTLTESDDAEMVAMIQKHVAVTGEFVAAGRDPNLPMSTPALHGVLQNGTRITRRVELTAKGALVIETSQDTATVRLLQAHAAEVTDLVKRGMAAMHGPPEPAAAPSPAAAPAMTHTPGMVHQPGMQHDAGMSHDATAPAARPTRAGQEAFATIGEIVRILDSNPGTDWSKVDLEALRAHLRDMDDVTLRATVVATKVDGGARFDVQGTGRVRDAIRRMALSHGATIAPADGFTWQAVETPTGARVTVRATTPSNEAMATRIRALGFIGLLTLGDHHTAHHLGIADGSMRGAHQHSASHQHR